MYFFQPPKPAVLLDTFLQVETMSARMVSYKHSSGDSRHVVLLSPHLPCQEEAASHGRSLRLRGPRLIGHAIRRGLFV